MKSTLVKQHSVDFRLTDKKDFEIKKTHDFRRVVKAKRLRPFKHHFEQSSLGIFSWKGWLRQLIFNVMIDPEFVFQDNSFNLVQLDDLDPYSRKEMLQLGYKKGYYVIQRHSNFFTVEWEMLEAYSQQVRRQKQ